MTAAAGEDEQRHPDQNLRICSVIRNSTSEDSEIEQKQLIKGEEDEAEEEELRRLLLPNVDELPQVPPSSIEANFTTYFAPGIVDAALLFVEKGENRLFFI